MMDEGAELVDAGNDLFSRNHSRREALLCSSQSGCNFDFWRIEQWITDIAVVLGRSLFVALAVERYSMVKLT